MLQETITPEHYFTETVADAINKISEIIDELSGVTDYVNTNLHSYTSETISQVGYKDAIWNAATDTLDMYGIEVSTDMSFVDLLSIFNLIIEYRDNPAQFDFEDSNEDGFEDNLDASKYLFIKHLLTTTVNNTEEDFIDNIIKVDPSIFEWSQRSLLDDEELGDTDITEVLKLWGSNNFVISHHPLYIEIMRSHKLVKLGVNHWFKFPEDSNPTVIIVAAVIASFINLPIHEVNTSTHNLVKGILNEFQYNMNKVTIDDFTNSLLNVYKDYFNNLTGDNT